MDKHEFCRKTLNGREFKLKVCGISDRFISEIDAIYVIVNDSFIEQWKNGLAVRADLHPDLIAYYDICQKIPALKDVLLSQRTQFRQVQFGGSFGIQMTECFSCKNSMSKTTDIKSMDLRSVYFLPTWSASNRSYEFVF